MVFLLPGDVPGESVNHRRTYGKRSVTDCRLRRMCTVLGAEDQVDQVPCQGL